MLLIVNAEMDFVGLVHNALRRGFEPLMVCRRNLHVRFRRRMSFVEDR